MISDTGAVFRGALAHNKARTVLSVIAIALGVALGYAVQLINQTAVNELTLGMQTLSGDADLEVRGPRGGFAENIYPTIAIMPEVAVASPVVEVDAKLTDRADSLRIVGIDIFRAGYLQPGLIPPATDRFDALRSDVLFLSPAAARWLDAKVGDTVVLQVALSDVPLRVAGLLTAGAAQRFAVMDIAAAQARFDRQGRIMRIDLRLKPGVDLAAFRRPTRQDAAGGARRRSSRREPCRERGIVALVPRQPQRARACRVVHRRSARLFDAGAGRGSPAGAARAVACARRDPAPPRHADRGRVGADRRRRERARPRRGLCPRAPRAALGRRRSRVRLFSRDRTDARARSGVDRPVSCARRRRRGARQLRPRARGRARGAGAGAQGRRRTARLRPAAAGLAGNRHRRRGRCGDDAAAGQRAAGLRL